MRGHAWLAPVLAVLLSLLACDFVKIGSLRKEVRAPIAPFAIQAAPFAILTSRTAFKRLVARYGLAESPTCTTAVGALLASCDVSHPCSFDALEETLRASCATSLAAGAGDAGGPRFQAWIVDTVGAALARVDTGDPHEGTFAYDLSAYLGAQVDFDSLDASTRRLVATVPVSLELRRTYTTSAELLGSEAAPVANLVKMPELRAVTVTELDLRTTRPDEPGLATTSAMLMDERRLASCTAGQPVFGGLVDIQVRVASLDPASIALTAPATGAIEDSAGEVVVEATLPPGTTGLCSIVATSRSPVNVAPYLSARSREIDVRIELATPLPLALDATCTASGCDTTTAYVGGFAWIEARFEDLDAHGVAAIVSAFRHPPASASGDAGVTDASADGATP